MRRSLPNSDWDWQLEPGPPGSGSHLKWASTKTICPTRGAISQDSHVMSVLFSRACRYEFFDRNSIRLSVKTRRGGRRRLVVTSREIKILLEGQKHARGRSYSTKN